MGLDQYLYATNYVSGGDWALDKDKELYAQLADTLNVCGFAHAEMPSIQTKVKVGYWRKANQIHQWFVDNVQRGEDNCAEYYVSRERLQELLDTCKEVLASKHPDVASDLLPTSQGFFFGSYDIDEWYWGQLEDTVEQISRLLKDVPSDWEFAYQSSW